MTDPRQLARSMARRALERGEPLGWFEELYSAARDGAVTVPWAEFHPDRLFVDWLDGRAEELGGRRAIVVGTGFGDDAAELARRGARVVAFDCAPSALERAAQRFGDLGIEWLAADLLHLPDRLRLGFDLVVEINTLQVLPPDLRPAAAAAIAGLVAPGGELFVQARLRLPLEPEGTMPWPLLEQELDAFEAAGLVRGERRVLLDDEEPPVRRILACLSRANPSPGRDGY